MIDLDEKYINFLKKIISCYLDDYKLYMFGSRVNGNARKYSDIDIAIKSDKLTSSIKSKIESDFENSTLPYEVDVVDLNTISDDFKNLIKNTLVEI